MARTCLTLCFWNGRIANVRVIHIWLGLSSFFVHGDSGYQLGWLSLISDVMLANDSLPFKTFEQFYIIASLLSNFHWAQFLFKVLQFWNKLSCHTFHDNQLINSNLAHNHSFSTLFAGVDVQGHFKVYTVCKPFFSDQNQRSTFPKHCSFSFLQQNFIQIIRFSSCI